MREEYIGWLYDFEREIPSIFDFRLRVETMKHKNVEDVIEKSCAAFNIALEAPQDNIRQIYDNVSEGKAVVQLPYLQVYLDTLYRTDVQRTYPAGAPNTDEQLYPPLTFTGKEIAECDHISGVLEGFLRGKVSELQESMAQKYPGLPADAVKTVLNSFVTAQEAAARDSTFLQIFLSYFALYAGKYQKSIEYARETLKLEPEDIAQEQILALSYLLNNQYEQAELIFKKWEDSMFVKYNQNGFLREIADLEAAGITHPDFARVRKLLRE